MKNIIIKYKYNKLRYTRYLNIKKKQSENAHFNWTESFKHTMNLQATLHDRFGLNPLTPKSFLHRCAFKPNICGFFGDFLAVVALPNFYCSIYLTSHCSVSIVGIYFRFDRKKIRCFLTAHSFIVNNTFIVANRWIEQSQFDSLAFFRVVCSVL